MMKKTFTLLVAIGLLVLSATPAFADDGGKGKVELKTKKTAAIVEGDTAWVAISWKAKRTDATSFRIVATTDTAGVTISYPENTAPVSSLMTDDTLSAGEIDFTSLRISVPYGTKKVKLKVTATWVQDGRNRSKDYKVTVPVAKFTGDDVAQVTTDVGAVSVTQPAWVDVEWTGIAPILTDVQMTVAGPSGIAITYPGDRTFTSLDYDNTLVAGETDVARVLLDVSGLAPGTYTLDVTLSYAKGGAVSTVTGQVSLTVTG